MKTRRPRSSFHHAVVTFFGSRRSTSLAKASAHRRTSGKVQFGSMRQAMWMPRLPDVFGQPVKPSSSSTSRTRSATFFASLKVVPGCGSTSIRSSSGLSTWARRDGQGWKSIVARLAAQATCATSVTQSSSACRPDGNVTRAVSIHSGRFSGTRFW